MPHWDPATLTEPQRKWFASVRDGLERETGRTLDANLAGLMPGLGEVVTRRVPP